MKKAKILERSTYSIGTNDGAQTTFTRRRRAQRRRRRRVASSVWRRRRRMWRPVMNVLHGDGWLSARHLGSSFAFNFEILSIDVPGLFFLSVTLSHSRWSSWSVSLSFFSLTFQSQSHSKLEIISWRQTFPLTIRVSRSVSKESSESTRTSFKKRMKRG